MWSSCRPLAGLAELCHGDLDRRTTGGIEPLTLVTLTALLRLDAFLLATLLLGDALGLATLPLEHLVLGEADLEAFEGDRPTAVADRVGAEGLDAVGMGLRAVDGMGIARYRLELEGGDQHRRELTTCQAAARAETSLGAAVDDPLGREQFDRLSVNGGLDVGEGVAGYLVGRGDGDVALTFLPLVLITQTEGWMRSSSAERFRQVSPVASSETNNRQRRGTQFGLQKTRSAPQHRPTTPNRLRAPGHSERR